MTQAHRQKSARLQQGSHCKPSPAPDSSPVPLTTNPSARPDNLWLAIHLPYLPLESLGYYDEQPTAVYTQQAQAQQVVTPNPQAKQNGIYAGMSLAAAHTLNPALQVVVQDRAAESVYLERLAVAARRWTPAVAVLEDGLLLDIAASVRLYGGISSLAEQVRCWITHMTLAACVSLTPTPASAILSARAGKMLCVTTKDKIRAAMHDLPAQALITESKPHRLLVQLGIRTIGDLLRLPRDGLARRLGPKLLTRLDRLLGQAPDPWAIFMPPPAFIQRTVLDGEGTDTARLRPFMVHLLEQLQTYLHQHRILAEQLQWQLGSERGPAQNIPVQLAKPHREACHLLRLSQLAFENRQTDAPITNLTLQVHRFAPETSSSEDLFSATPDDANDGNVLVECLQNRLGLKAVQGIRIQADHRPEQAWVCCVPGESGPIPHTAQRPLWLLQKPRPVQVRRYLLNLGGQQLQLERQRERICSGWWDNQPVRRDYYQAATGALKVWVFRDLDSGRWCLHGIF